MSEDKTGSDKPTETKTEFSVPPRAEVTVNMLKLAHAGANSGTVVVLRPVKHCGVVWSSEPNVLVKYPNGGWTRAGRCGKCDIDLTPFQPDIQ